MAAISADALRDSRNRNSVKQETFPIKTSVTLYIGEAVAFSTLNRLTTGAAAASLRPAGVVTAFVNESGLPITAGTGNAGGTVKATIEWGCEFLFTILTAAATYVNVGKNVFLANNNEMTDTTAAGTAAVRVKFGSIAGFALTAAGAPTKTSAWVAVRVYGDADAT